ncbi:3-oxoacyl-ACP synthase III [Ruania suaedae]|uniref:3-oxoacyl-ACP synthase III n=1 Tax=Ruania suaedae TaxID=2897774 RepID=UPI001E55BF5E|nr:3-oxoacyl-ACP synthase III [Ruania suaedae]UFU01696.1 3-oxoacyl-ACP synthase III [Ruania suaedae]
MHGNNTARFAHAAMLSVTSGLPGAVTTSAQLQEDLAEVLDRLRLPRTLLERVAGVKERRTWAPDEDMYSGTIEAANRALEQADVEPGQIDLLINTSVSRPHLEPSVAARLHHGLGLPSSALNFDVTNACLGFVNGMSLAASMIETGQIRHALVVAGENAADVHAATIERLLTTEPSRDELMQEFATLTLGSGAAATVIGPAGDHPGGHRLLGGVTRAATQFHDLCVGSADGMFTDAAGLLRGGLDLVVSAWHEAEPEWRWSQADRFVTHQVSRAHTDAITEAIDLDPVKVPTTYATLGNVGPASLPITLAAEQDSLEPGDRVVLMGVGSGLNTALMEITW